MAEHTFEAIPSLIGRYRVEDKIGGTGAGGYHRFAPVMAVQLDDPFGRERKLCHHLSVRITGRPCSRPQGVNDAHSRRIRGYSFGGTVRRYATTASRSVSVMFA